MITSAFTCTGPYAILIMLGIKRTDALLEYAVQHGDVEEAERLRAKLKRLTEKF